MLRQLAAPARIGHPIARSAEAREHWSWCYVDELTLEVSTRS